MISELDYNELIRYRDGPVPIREKISKRTERLGKSEYLTVDIIDDGTDGSFVQALLLTPAGEDALLEYEKALDKERKDDADKKSDRKFQLLNTLLGAVIGCVMTLLVEHFDAVLDVLRAFFQ